jgi:excisionase family DNA binding protein
MDSVAQINPVDVPDIERIVNAALCRVFTEMALKLPAPPSVPRPRVRKTDPPEPQAYRFEDAARVLGIGRTSVYELVAEGKLKKVTIAGRSLITAESIRQLIQEAA